MFYDSIKLLLCVMSIHLIRNVIKNTISTTFHVINHGHPFIEIFKLIDINIGKLFMYKFLSPISLKNNYYII